MLWMFLATILMGFIILAVDGIKRHNDDKMIHRTADFLWGAWMAMIALIVVGNFTPVATPDYEKYKDSWWSRVCTFQRADGTRYVRFEFRGKEYKFEGKVGE